MTIPKDFIEQAEKEFEDFTKLAHHKWSSDAIGDMYEVSQEFLDLQFKKLFIREVSLAYRRGAEDMGKAIDEVENPYSIIAYPHVDTIKRRDGFEEALALIQERKEQFLK